jgi:4a-hydroxytetrahydrobiopterin dehydratase
MRRDTSDVSAPEGWTARDGALERTFVLPSFSEAIAFVNRVAVLAEKEDHHPDIAVSYKKVTLRWTSHSEGGITDRDYALAERSDALAET